MRQISSRQRKVTQDDCEVISIMIQYIKNELPDTCSSKVEKLIFGCKECQHLFEDVKFFFDEDEALTFELLNAEKVNKARANFNNCTIQKIGLVTESPSLFQDNHIDNDDLSGWWNRPCFCCED